MGEQPKHIIIYTDGACLGNPGPGGYGVVLISGESRQEMSGGFRLTTNNRMELLAAIVGLRAIKGTSTVTLYSDSQYLVNAITKGWAKGWKARGWRRSNKEKALNPDLWEELLNLCVQHNVTFMWVRGHAGNRENECCDGLSVQAAKQQNLPPDTVYEKGRNLS